MLCNIINSWQSEDDSHVRVEQEFIFFIFESPAV